LHSLGRISFQNGDLEAAHHFLAQALQLAPNSVEALHLQGVTLMRLGSSMDALDCLNRAVATAPDFAEAILNRATLLLALNQPDEALAGFDRFLSLDPHNPVGWNNRGNALVALGRLKEAAAAYQHALEIDPSFEAAHQNRFYALLALRDVAQISGFAVRQAFDSVAHRYNEMMLKDLNYRAPEHLRLLASRILPRLVPPLQILDLGCGTGLVGESFRALATAGRLDGVDISPLMIEEARKLRLYDRLTVANIEDFLVADGPSYELVVSGDTLVYFGDLTAVFDGVAKRLQPGGLFLFTCEAKRGDGWELTAANRFRHSEHYLRERAGSAGLYWIDVADCILRREREQDVPGFAVALRKPHAALKAG
jgi:predicted TPR repeat methyltransferase